MIKTNKRIDINNLPKHIAFIMDGNRRWAKHRGLPGNKGHEEGGKKMMTALERCVELGIGVVSFYAFSTENWLRNRNEIDFIFETIRKHIDDADIDKLVKNGIKVVTMGDITKFPKDLQDKLKDAIKKTKGNKKCILNLCVNYGGRAEIVKAVNMIISAKEKAVDEESFKKYLFSSDLPDPDLIVRTSGEHRISNFMLYQMAYSEFYFPKICWPAINKKFIDKCVIEFQKRKRRFGKA